MKWLFKKLLERYSKTESERLEIFKVLDEQVQFEYSEQSRNGNVYNLFLEFVISNNLIIDRLNVEDYESIKKIKSLINKGFDSGLTIIEEEILKPKENGNIND